MNINPCLPESSVNAGEYNYKLTEDELLLLSCGEGNKLWLWFITSVAEFWTEQIGVRERQFFQLQSVALPREGVLHPTTPTHWGCDRGKDERGMFKAPTKVSAKLQEKRKQLKC